MKPVSQANYWISLLHPQLEFQLLGESYDRIHLVLIRVVKARLRLEGHPFPVLSSDSLDILLEHPLEAR